VAAEQVWVVVGEDDDLAGGDLDGLVIGDLRRQASLDHVVIKDDVLDAFEQLAAILRREAGENAPRSRELRVQEYAALQPNDAQDVRKSIHGSAFRRRKELLARKKAARSGFCRVFQGQIKAFSKIFAPRGG
jgi:hypothetical protein